MAELLTTEGWVKSGSAGAYLREALPDDYIVVANPRVAGHPMSAAVVGRGALFVVEDIEGEQARGAAEPDAASGRLPANGRDAAQAAVRFLEEEFPALAVPVFGVRGARDWADGPATWRVIEPAEWTDLPLADAILMADSETSPFGPADAREELALGLRDRQITSNQTTRRPFVFRSGGGLRTGAKVTTVRAAVEHMERYPADGIQVLRDGTLARWLEEEGALHLAAQARDALLQPKPDARIALEIFLAGTGFIHRPQPVAKPERIDLRYVAQGQRAARKLSIERPRDARGHLFGTAAGGDHWVRIEPREFAGSPADFVVSVDTAELRIAAEPYLSFVSITTGAGAAPLIIPLSAQVVAEPPAFIRRVIRPLTGFLVAALIGGGLGLLAGITRLVAPHEALPAAILLALMWGLAGALRGWHQPAAWPTKYALGRWSLKTVAWSMGLAVLAFIIAQAWRLGLGGGLQLEGLTLAATAVAGAMWGFGPATLDELAQSRHARDPEYAQGRRHVRRPALIGAGLIALLIVALLAPRAISAVISEQGAQTTLRTGGAWIEQRLNDLGNAMDNLLDRATLEYYDRPAPGAAGGATPAPAFPEIKVPEIKVPNALGGG